MVIRYISYLLCDALPGSFLDQKSTLFQEEFPQLAAGREGHLCTSRENDVVKETQYGPGPSLRPQSMCCALLSYAAVCFRQFVFVCACVRNAHFRLRANALTLIAV